MKLSIKIILLILFCIGLHTNPSAAAQAQKQSRVPVFGKDEVYAPDSLEAMALSRAKTFPDPDVNLPPIDTNTATMDRRIQYGREHCAAYAKAYEDQYLKQFHVGKTYSPFLNFCERHTELLKTGIFVSRAIFKLRMDRVAMAYELSGGLANAQAQYTQSAIVQKLNTDLTSSTKAIETLTHQVNEIMKNQSRIETQFNTQKNSPKAGFLGAMGMDLGLELKIIELLLIVCLGTGVFLFIRNS